MINLKAIFGDCPAWASDQHVLAVQPKAVPITTASDGPGAINEGSGEAAPAAVPEAAGEMKVQPEALAEVLLERSLGKSFPKARVQPAALAEVPLEWIEPGKDIWLPPCPTCGSSDLWETILGEWKCRHCDAAALARSRLFADKAARLREESPRQRPAAERRDGRCPGPVDASGLPTASSGV